MEDGEGGADRTGEGGRCTNVHHLEDAREIAREHAPMVPHAHQAHHRSHPRLRRFLRQCPCRLARLVALHP